MSGFARHRKSGAVIADFTDFEADLLRSLAAQIVELLSDQRATTGNDPRDPFEAMMDFSGPTSTPEDPVLARLLPSAYPGDEEAAAEFRRFTEGTVRDGKATAATTIIDSLEEAGLPAQPAGDGLHIDIELAEPEAEIWLRAFTDIRLALATRLGVTEGDQDYWHALPGDDPRSQTHHIYEWVGYLQETLVSALTR